MKYEIDFIGVNEESSKDAAATCFRFYVCRNYRYDKGLLEQRRNSGRRNYNARKRDFNRSLWQHGRTLIINFMLCLCIVFVHRRLFICF